MSRAFKATILILALTGLLLVGIAPFLPSILPTSLCTFPCNSSDPNDAVFGFVVIGSSLLFLAGVLEVVRRKENPPMGNTEKLERSSV